MSKYKTPNGVVEFSGKAFKALEPQQQKNLKALWDSGAQFDHNFLLSQPKDKQENLFNVLNARQQGQSTAIDVEAQRPQREAPNYITGLADAAAQGLSAGGIDELQAAGSALLGSGSYDFYHNDLRERREAFKRENEYAAMGAEMGGAMLGLGKLNALALAKTAGKPMIARAGAAMGLGAAEGATYGALSGDGFDNRVSEAGSGALLGMAGTVGGKGVELLLEGFGGAFNAAKRKLLDTPRAEVERRLAMAANADGVDADEAIKMLDQMGPESTIMDLGENLRALAADVRRKVGQGKAMLPDFVNARQRGVRAENGIDRVNSQQTRLLDAAEESAGTSGADLKRSMEAVQKEMREKAGPLYDAAYATPYVLSGEVKRLLKKDAVETAYENAVTRINNKVGDISLSPVQRLDETIRDLEDQASELFRKGKGGAGGDVAGLAEALRKQLDSEVPELPQARAIWREGKEAERAADLGRGVLKTDPEDLQAGVAKMSASELDMFRRGGMRAVNDAVDNTADNLNAGAKLSSKQRTREQLGVLFDDIDPFLKQLDAEEAFTRTKQVVTGGSVTNEATQVQNAFGGADALDAAMTMQTGVGTLGAVQGALKIINKQPELSAEAATELAQILINKGITSKEVRELLNSKALKDAAGSVFPEFSKALKDGITGATIGGVLAVTSE